MYPEFAENFCKNLVINYKLRDEQQTKKRPFGRQKLVRVCSNPSREQSEGIRFKKFFLNFLKKFLKISQNFFSDVRAFSTHLTFNNNAMPNHHGGGSGAAQPEPHMVPLADGYDSVRRSLHGISRMDASAVAEAAEYGNCMAKKFC